MLPFLEAEYPSHAGARMTERPRHLTERPDWAGVGGPQVEHGSAVRRHSRHTAERRALLSGGGGGAVVGLDHRLARAGAARVARIGAPDLVPYPARRQLL